MRSGRCSWARFPTYKQTDYARKTRQGALAQYVRLPASCLVNLPPNVGPVQAAGFACAAMTAYQALLGVGGLRPGQRVLVNGASAAVGACAVQIAKAEGCWVAGSASGGNRGFVEGMGVDEVRMVWSWAGVAGLVLTCFLVQFFDDTEAPIHKVLATSGSELPYDVVFDAVGLLDTSLYTHSAAYLKPGGTFVSTGPQPHGFDILGIIRFLWDVFLHPGFLGGTRRTWRYVSSPLALLYACH